MSESSRKQSVGRRQFLARVAAVTGAGVATAAVLDRTLEAPPAPDPARTKPGRGYRLTEHVRKYYAKARI